MNVHRHVGRGEVARAAAHAVADLIRAAIQARGIARLLVAASGIHAEVLAPLVRAPGVAWGNVELFQASELMGLAADHPASSRQFLFEHLILPARIGRYHLLDGGGDAERRCREVGAALAAAPADIALVDVGENGRLAFNEPPADFTSERPYLLVQLELAGRIQQMEPGRFPTLTDVPSQAITISVRQLLKASAILCTVAEAHVAPAIRRCMEGPVSPLAPASILKTHPDTRLFLEANVAALLGAPKLG